MKDPASNDPALRAWRQAYRATQAAGSSACPSDERLIALVLDEIADAERNQLVNHVVRCRPCTTTCHTLLRLQRVVDTELPDADSRKPTARTRVRQRGRRGKK